MSEKCQFILDECVIRHADSCEDGTGTRDFSAVRLMYAIADYCHKIVVNGELAKRYWRHADKLKSSNIVRLLLNILPNEDKMRYKEFESFPLPDSSDIPSEDLFLIELAFRSKAILVTSDRDLLMKLRPDNDGKVHRLGIRALLPSQALDEVMDWAQNKGLA